jgi:hypothetical protein
MLRPDLVKITTVLLLLVCEPSLGQRLVMQLDAREVSTGSTFELTYVLQDALADRFSPPAAFPGFKRRSGPSEVRSTGFRNGAMYRHQSWVYVLEAQRPGTFQLPVARANVAGKILESNTLVIRITPSERTGQINAPSSDQDVFISAEIVPASLYPGQQAVYRITLYSRTPVSSVSMVETPELSAELARPLTRFDTRSKKIIINSATYEVRTIYELAFFPQTTGVDTLGPSTVQAAVDRPSGIPGLTIPAPVLLQTPPVRYQVKALPQPVPDDFSGAVGQFVMEATLINNQVPIGQGALLKVALRGNGNPRRYRLPELPVLAGLDMQEPTITAQETYENGEQWIHAKSVQYLLIAEKTGAYPIRPTFSFFNPDSNQYIRLSPLQPLHLHALEATSGFLSPAPPSLEQYKPQVLWEYATELSVLAIVLCALGGIFWILTKQQSTESQQTRLQHRTSQDAWLLAQKAQLSAPVAYCELLLFAIQQQLSDICGLAPSAQSKATVKEALLSDPDRAHIVESLIELLEHSERVVYANAPLWDSPENIWRAANQIRYALQKPT